MTFRHAALAVGATLVLGLGVYLFVEVRTQPATVERPAQPAAETAAESAPPPSPTDRPGAAAPAVAARSSPVAAAAAITPSRQPPAVSGAGADAGSAASGDDLTGPKLDAAMAEANAAYDRSDYDEARTLAMRLLAHQPGNVRMLRILVSASCIEGDGAAAQLSYQKLPPSDQAQMRVRCARYGVTFADKP